MTPSSMAAKWGASIPLWRLSRGVLVADAKEEEEEEEWMVRLLLPLRDLGDDDVVALLPVEKRAEEEEEEEEEGCCCCEAPSPLPSDMVDRRCSRIFKLCTLFPIALKYVVDGLLLVITIVGEEEGKDGPPPPPPPPSPPPLPSCCGNCSSWDRTASTVAETA